MSENAAPKELTELTLKATKALLNVIATLPDSVYPNTAIVSSRAQCAARALRDLLSSKPLDVIVRKALVDEGYTFLTEEPSTSE